MTTVLLIRHAWCAHVGLRIVGRAPGIHLDARGEAEARLLSSSLQALPIAAVYSSPLERALETALPLARSLGLTVEPSGALTELDFGEWTGRSFDELATDPRWHQFNVRREATRIPGGESAPEAVERAAAEVERLRMDHPESMLALITHGDIVRGLLLHFLGMPLDAFNRIQVDPASVSIVMLSAHEAQVHAINWTSAGPASLVQPAGPLAC